MAKKKTTRSQAGTTETVANARQDESRNATAAATQKDLLARRLLGLYLVAVALAFTVAIVVAWPESAKKANVDPLASKDRQLLLLAILAGGVGASIHALQSFTAFIGNQRFERSWMTWYYVRPVIGMLLALLSYLVVRGGLIQGNSPDMNPYGIAALGGLAGMFSKKAVDKLAEVCDAVFHVKNAVKESGALKDDNVAVNDQQQADDAG